MTTAGAAYSRNRGLERRTAITQAQPNSGTSASPNHPPTHMPHHANGRLVAPPALGHLVADQVLDQRIEPSVSLDQLVAMQATDLKKTSGSVVDEPCHGLRAERP